MSTEKQEPPLPAPDWSALREALEMVVSELTYRHPINSYHLERNDCSTCRALLAAKDALAVELPQDEPGKEAAGKPCPKCASTNTLSDETGLLCIECGVLFTQDTPNTKLSGGGAAKKD